MKLHYAEVLNPRKVCALAKHIGAPVEYRWIDLAKSEHHRPAFWAMNPNAKVPVLEDGATILWESDAIMCHLARATGSDLWPNDARQSEVLRWLSWNLVHFQPIVGTFYFERVVKPMFGIGAPDAAKVAAAVKPFTRAAQILDAHLADRAYLVGDQLTIADFSTAISLPYAAETDMPVDAFSAIRRWHDRLCALDAWREPFPVRLAAD